MATLQIGDILEVVLTWDTPLASVAQNVWHYIMVSGADADSDDLLDEINTQIDVAFGSIEGYISDDFQGVLYELRKYDFVNSRFDGIGTKVATGLTGVSAVDYEPHGVAGLGRIITLHARRQGRTFVPGFVDSAIVNGALTGPAEAGLAAYLAVFDGTLALVAGNFAWCTFNVEPLSPVYETESQAAGTVVANSLPSYLSKRKPGTGL